MALTEALSKAAFRFVHRNSLVYNSCWEDPRLDRAALDIGPDDRMMVITSAGCNVLDYALCAPEHIYAVDVNPFQNALLELKIAGIKALEHAQFFELFGQGRSQDFVQLYVKKLRPLLSFASQNFWDRRTDFFKVNGWRDSFYFRGTSGFFARLVNHYIDRSPALREAVDGLLAAQTLEEQRSIYDAAKPAFWNSGVRRIMNWDVTLSLLGVPRAQKQELQHSYQSRIADFIEDCIDGVFARIPLRDNYFWRVYLTGAYTPDCCPEYLKSENFYALKNGLVECISAHTSTVTEHLQNLVSRDRTVSKFVLLDHMDWLASHDTQALEDEWQAIMDVASPNGTKLIWRSGGTKCSFLNDVKVTRDLSRNRSPVKDYLKFDAVAAENLHKRDRVHTYGSFYIADLVSA